MATPTRGRSPATAPRRDHRDRSHDRENGITHQPTLLIATPGRHLRWLGKLPVPGLFAGRHEFILEPVTEGTRLVHREEFNGLLVPFLRKTLQRTEAGFHELNQALKKRAEQQIG